MVWTEKNIDYECKGIDAWQSAKCPYCNTYLTTPYMYSFHNYNFCPTCGCDMRTYPTDFIK